MSYDIRDINEIEIINKIMCELIDKNVRQAWLIQSCDYKFDESVIDSIMKFIQSNYPSLKIQIFNKDNYLICKDTTDIDINKSFETLTTEEFNEFLGKILGFTCSNKDMKRSYDINYHQTIRSEDSCSYSVCFSSPIHLISYICSCDDSDLCRINVNEFKNKILDCINNIPEFKEFENDVDINTNEYISVEHIIEKLINSPTKLSSNEKWEATNYLYNLNFSSDFHDTIMNTEFQYDNPIHVGILLTLLSEYNHDIIEPFCPIQHSGKMNEFEGIKAKREAHLKELIIKTKK